MKARRFTYNLIPTCDIKEETRKLAVAWVDGLPTKYSTVMPAIAQKQKLASDIQNYAEQFAIDCVIAAIKLARKGAEWEIGTYSGKPLEKLTQREILDKIGL